MKRIRTKEFLLLCVPAILLLGFSLALPSKPTLKLKSVQVKPTIRASDGSIRKGYTDVEVFVDYREPGLARFTQGSNSWAMEPGLCFNAEYGLYVEDERGRIYGKSCSLRDTKTYRPFKASWFPLGVGIGGSCINGNPWSWRFKIPVSQIPESAGQLTLKTVLEAGRNMDSPARLPLAVIVRKG